MEAKFEESISSMYNVSDMLMEKTQELTTALGDAASDVKARLEMQLTGAHIMWQKMETDVAQVALDLQTMVHGEIQTQEDQFEKAEKEFKTKWQAAKKGVVEEWSVQVESFKTNYDNAKVKPRNSKSNTN